ncbi:acetoacetate--CoA ligase [Aeromicrobium massiliense]|uniref:acetoacetate--CoA ligase n=1 Tax=Aeromicrobium massiliense TaxID=1464554 RepID=UPI0002EC7374|nr:acetoacetate--CoA ligase [Aeromicrobium massiliense]
MSEVLWRPSGRRTRLDDFRDELACLGHRFDDYESLWRWSVDDLDAFWLAAWRFVDIPSDTAPTVALADDAMPGAHWFPQVRINYAEAMLRLPDRADDDVVVVGRSQSRDDVRLTAAELRDQVARARAGLVRAGVGRGDRVAAYAPNVPETLVLLLAAASLGAVFTSCAPEFGTQSVVDRWRQVEPTLLLAVDGYRYGDKPVDRRAEVEQVCAALPSVRTLVHLPYLDPGAAAPDGATTWAELLAEPAEPAFDRVPFDHPLYVLFSSGTTGLPKPIVHGHGGITLEHLKCFALQNDVGPGDRFFWFSTTGWMMWNYLVSALGVGATIVMLDGNPAHPDLGALWRLVEQERLTYFGTSAPYLLQCRKAGLVLRDEADLSSLRAIGSTGAPLPTEGFRWVYDAVVPDGQDVQLVSISGGTDVCSAFVGGAPDVPVVAGEISCRALGAAVQAYDLAGEPVVGELGELVVTRPMPSMPVGFWGDDDGSRYRAAYFEDFPGVWRHGDWITITAAGTCVVSGRSDATLNRGGVRLGTAEFYGVVESLPQVADSLVVHLEDDEGGAGRLILFVVMAEGETFDDDVRHEIATALRSRLSPRHVPDDVAAVRALPRTLSGKKLEVPVKKILRGTPVEDAAARGALVDPTALDEIVRYREAQPGA